MGAVDRGLGGDGLVARRRLDLGQAPARAHEQDRGDDGEAQHAESERERGDLVAVEQRQRGDVVVKDREFVARACRRGAGAAARQQHRQHERAGGAQSALARPCARAGTRVVLRMSPNALHGGPDRLRHSRLPQLPHLAASCDAGSRIARRSASFRRTVRESGHFTPNRNCAGSRPDREQGGECLSLLARHSPARPREGGDPVHSASKTRVNALMGPGFPSISAFTRVHSPSKTGVNALNDALCAGMSGVLLRYRGEERIFTPVRRA